VIGSDEFLIIGCDGLWDGLTPDDATQERQEIKRAPEQLLRAVKDPD
jgi:serine/threonine protein phosphatase PrpC